MTKCRKELPQNMLDYFHNKPTKNSWLAYGCLILLLLFSAGLLWHLNQVQPQVGHEHLPRIGERDGHPLNLYESNGVFYYQIHSLFFTDSSPILAKRSISIISGLLLIVMVFVIGKHLSGARFGLCAAFILVANSEFIMLSIHHRFYIFSALMCAIATWLLIKSCQKQGTTWWVLYALAMVSCATSMVLSLAVFPIHILMTLWLVPREQRWPSLRKLAMIGFILLGTFIWMNYRDPQAMNRPGYTSLPYYKDCYEVWLHNGFDFVSIVVPTQNEFCHQLKELLLPLKATLTFTAVIILCQIPFTRAEDKCAKVSQACALGLLFTITSYWIFSVLYQNIINAQNTVWFISLFCLLIGYGISRYRLLRLSLLCSLFLATPVLFMPTYATSEGENEIYSSFFNTYVRNGDFTLLDVDANLIRPINFKHEDLLLVDKRSHRSYQIRKSTNYRNAEIARFLLIIAQEKWDKAPINHLWVYTPNNASSSRVIQCFLIPQSKDKWYILHRRPNNYNNRDLYMIKFINYK